jgi:hypothetical protein
VTTKFVIATDPMSPSENKALKEFLAGRGWWKWLPSFWLVVDNRDELTAQQIRDKIYEINNSVRAWVFAVEPTDWAGLTKEDSEGRDGSEWIVKNFMPRQ